MRQSIACFIPVALADVRISRAALLLEPSSSADSLAAASIDVAPDAAVNSNSGGGGNCTTSGMRRLSVADLDLGLPHKRGARDLAAKPDLRIDLFIVGSCTVPALGSSSALASRLALFNFSGAAAGGSGNAAPGTSLVRLFIDAVANASGVSGAGVNVNLWLAAPDTGAASVSTAAPTVLVIGSAAGAALMVLLCCAIGGVLLLRRRCRQCQPGKAAPAQKPAPGAPGGPMTPNPMHARRRRVSSAPLPSSAAPLQSPLPPRAAPAGSSSASVALPLSPPFGARATASAVPPLPTTPAVAAASPAALGFAVSRSALSAVRRRPAAPPGQRDGSTGAAPPQTPGSQSGSLSGGEEASEGGSRVFVPASPPSAPMSASLSDLLGPDHAWRENPLSRRSRAAAGPSSTVRLQPKTAAGGGGRAAAAGAAAVPPPSIDAADFHAWKGNPIARRSAALHAGLGGADTNAQGRRATHPPARHSHGSAPPAMSGSDDAAPLSLSHDVSLFAQNPMYEAARPGLGGGASRRIKREFSAMRPAVAPEEGGQG